MLSSPGDALCQAYIASPVSTKGVHVSTCLAQRRHTWVEAAGIVGVAAVDASGIASWIKHGDP